MVHVGSTVSGERRGLHSSHFLVSSEKWEATLRILFEFAWLKYPRGTVDLGNVETLLHCYIVRHCSVSLDASIWVWKKSTKQKTLESGVLQTAVSEKRPSWVLSSP